MSLLGVLWLLGSGFAPGQAGPMFEVATIRASAPDATAETGSWSVPGIGRFTASHLPLTNLIQLAYDVDAKQIVGRVKGLDATLFDVNAKPEEGVKLTREELRPRLQNLLRQRFHLEAHWETRMQPGYGLVVAKGGVKLKATESKTFANFRVGVTNGRIAVSNASMAFLAAQLQGPAGLPVEDRTGLTGSYDLDVSFAPNMSVDSALPSVFQAVEESLGLRLEARKVPVQVLVIDHVEERPTEN